MTVVQFDSHPRKSPDTWVAPQLAVIVPSYNERDNVPLLYEKVTAALGATPFEFIVVDDNSPDGTSEVVREMARRHQNVRGIHRLGRRGLSSAVVEGILASAAPYFAVIDADLQHDETILPQMLDKAIAGDHIVVGTRYGGEGSVGEGLSKTREAGSRFATKLSSLVTGKSLSDPMSGFFLMRRSVFDEIAPSLSDDGFKVLLDIIVSAGRSRARQGKELRIGEVPYTFRPRHAGESKMSSIVVVQFLGLIVSKLSGGLLPTTFLLFALVGGFGVVVHMATLGITHELLGFNFFWAQVAATLLAMTFNFMLNNELTYANKKLRGWRYLTGMLTFYAVCSIGALANVSVASWIYAYDGQFYVAGLLGVLMSVVFNYSVTKVFTWR
ncbi:MULTISPECIES: glycosyltransferase family 2 protein [unclassified Devosia]|uniref:glycosyltransferase n=1 Tax=unclassified Devosia TaxID=196773 RepID=UPI00086912D3|nr:MULTISPECIES: glycosyltransferase family 2 protein [unclassified Devosia]MBN9360538.1 glycosyltransferase family 2 protein [Devosia sp.]ODS82358.1 MAG: dolichol monophosphate mannose synthase [Devosia sp. SCN 66-27]OJX22533.1 MAG: dolichol monophosphate mannose synthase [Devosia sp. 66-14]